ncbi:hypothetical protein Tco_0209900 [Tanacetum coccineum]
MTTLDLSKWKTSPTKRKTNNFRRMRGISKKENKKIIKGGRRQAGHLKKAEVKEAQEDPWYSHGWMISQRQSQTDSALVYNKKMGHNTSRSRQTQRLSLNKCQKKEGCLVLR